MQRHKPDAVICVGQAGGRAAITPEKVAINFMDGRIPDNAGYQPVDVPIREDGETAYFTSLPVKAMVQRMRDAGIPAAVSYTAGTYVCNYLLYTLLYLIDKKYPNVRGGFIHVPYAMEQVINKPLGTPSMDLRQIARGLGNGGGSCGGVRLRKYRIILSADTASEVRRQLLSQKRR